MGNKHTRRGRRAHKEFMTPLQPAVPPPPAPLGKKSPMSDRGVAVMMMTMVIATVSERERALYFSLFCLEGDKLVARRERQITNILAPHSANNPLLRKLSFLWSNYNIFLSSRQTFFSLFVGSCYVLRYSEKRRAVTVA